MNGDDSQGSENIELDLDVSYLTYCGQEIIRVYFASPLTGLSEADQMLSAQIREQCAMTLQDSGQYAFSVYDPAKNTPPGTTHSPVEVYCTDHDKVINSDVVFFFLLAPSTGMGMEAQIATDATLPRVVIRKKDSSITRMFLGAPSRTIGDIEFETVPDVRQQVSAQIATIWKESHRSRHARMDALGYGTFDRLSHAILKKRIRLGLTLDDLSNRTNLGKEWLAHVERTPLSASNMSMPQFLQLASHLEFEFSGGFNFRPSKSEVIVDPLERALDESLDNLVDFALKRAAGADCRI